MAQTYPLDTVIRIVDKETAPPTSAAEKLVAIDVERRKVAAPRWYEYFREYKYFLVSNTLDGRKEAEGRIPGLRVRDFIKNRELELSVTYLASCAPGNEEKVAAALFEGPNPGAALDDLIGRWVKEFTRGRPAEFIDNYYARKAELEEHIAERALDDVGLHLTAYLSLDEEEKLKPLVVGPVHFPVRVRDYDEEQPLKVKVELLADEQGKIKAVLHYSKNDELKEVLHERFRAYFAFASLQQLYMGLEDEELRRKLVEELNSALAPSGRRVGFMSLESATNPDWQEFFETEQDILCKVHKYPKTIIVNNKVQMLLKDIARYKAAKSPPLEEWLRKTLERVLSDLLFDQRYTDLLLRFAPLEQQIKEALTSEAALIGYDVRQLITVPNLEQLVWKEKFTVEAAEQFETSFSKVFVELEIVVTARFESFEGIEQYLDTQQDVMALVKEAVVGEAREFLHTVSPERFYVRFNYPDKQLGEKKSVRGELAARVENVLQRMFGAKATHITPKVVETDIIKRLTRLERELCEFEVKVVPLRVEEAVPFKGTFQVGVHADGWSTFQTRDYEMEKIKRYVEEAILEKLGTRSIDELRYVSDDHLNDIRREAEEKAQRSVLGAFGLALNITSFRRELTGPENEKYEKLEDIRKKTIKTFADIRERELDTLMKRGEDISTQIARLSSNYTQLVSSDSPDEQELSEVARKIEMLQKELAGLSRQTLAAQISEEEQFLIPESRQIGQRQRAALPAAETVEQG